MKNKPSNQLEEIRQGSYEWFKESNPERKEELSEILVKQIEKVEESLDQALRHEAITEEEHKRFKHMLRRYKEIVTGKIDALKMIKVKEALIPEDFMITFVSNEKIVMKAFESIRKTKVRRDKDISILEEEIAATVEKIFVVNEEFAGWLEEKLYVELYIVAEKHKDKITPEMLSRLRARSVEFKAKEYSEGGGTGEGSGGKEKTKELSKGESLFSNPESLGMSHSGGEEMKRIVSGEASIIDDYMTDVERKFVPDLARLQDELGRLDSLQNPMQRMIGNLYSVNVVGPCISYLNNSILCPEGMAKMIAMELLSTGNLIVNTLLDDRVSQNLYGVIEKIFRMIEGTVSHVNAIPLIGIEISLGSEYMAMKRILFDLSKDGVLRGLDEITKRDPVEVELERAQSKYPCTRLKRLVFLCETFRQANMNNPNALISIQFLMETLSRIRDDKELSELAPSLKPVIALMYDCGYIKVGLPAFASLAVTKNTVDVFLDIVLPSAAVTKEKLQESNSLSRKIEPILQVIEEEMKKYPQKFQQQNLLIGYMIENIRNDLRTEGGEKAVKNKIKSLRKEVSRLKGLFETFAGGNEFTEDPLLASFLKDDSILEATLDVFYKHEAEESISGEDVQLENLRNIVKILIRNSKDSSEKKILIAVNEILRGFKSDKELYRYWGRFESVINPILFNEKYAGIQLRGEGKEFLRKMVLGKTKDFPEADPEAVEKLAKEMGAPEELATMEKGKAVVFATTLILKNPSAGKLNVALGAVAKNLEYRVKNYAPKGYEDLALSAFRFAFKNYEGYLIEKYDNSTLALYKNRKEESERISQLAEKVIASPWAKGVISPEVVEKYLEKAGQIALVSGSLA